MWPIGTCSSLRPGKSGVHIARETWPCSDETALARLRRLQRQHRHAEVFAAVVRVDAAERHQLRRGRGPSASRSGPRCSSIRSRREAIVAGRHRRVRGEDDLRRDAAHALPDASMPSVAIRWRTSSSAANALCPSLRCRTPGEMPMRRERPDAADAEQQLLADADALVAAVQARRQLAILRLVALDVRVEQQQRVAADRHLPDAGGDRAGPRLDRRS